MIFRCKVCAEKTGRIDDLKDQIKSLLALVHPQNSAHAIPLTQVEADAVMTGRDDLIEINTDNLDSRQRQELLEIEREAQRILAGTY